DRRLTLAERRAQLKGLSPQAQLRNARQRAAHLSARAATAMLHRLALERERWHGWVQALKDVSPLAVLEGGYAIVNRPTGAIVRRAMEVKPGDPLRVRVSEGEFEVKVS